MIVKILIFVLAVVFSVSGDVSHLDPSKLNPVTDKCLECICTASSDCNAQERCNGDVCGLFRITWAYWADGGKPTIGGEDPTSPTAYSNCAVNAQCAASAVQGYMRKFGQDCNEDGVINCYDHAAIHRMGGYGCRNTLPAIYQNKFNQCLQQYL